MSNRKRGLATALLLGVLASQASAEVNLDAVICHGKELYNAPASCHVCHRDTGAGQDS